MLPSVRRVRNSCPRSGMSLADTAYSITYIHSSCPRLSRAPSSLFGPAEPWPQADDRQISARAPFAFGHGPVEHSFRCIETEVRAGGNLEPAPGSQLYRE
jgi:hypothetical protein